MKFQDAQNCSCGLSAQPPANCCRPTKNQPLYSASQSSAWSIINSCSIHFRITYGHAYTHAQSLTISGEQFQIPNTNIKNVRRNNFRNIHVVDAEHSNLCIVVAYLYLWTKSFIWLTLVVCLLHWWHMRKTWRFIQNIWNFKLHTIINCCCNLSREKEE